MSVYDAGRPRRPRPGRRAGTPGSTGASVMLARYGRRAAGDRTPAWRSTVTCITNRCWRGGGSRGWSSTPGCCVGTSATTSAGSCGAGSTRWPTQADIRRSLAMSPTPRVSIGRARCGLVYRPCPTAVEPQGSVDPPLARAVCRTTPGPRTPQPRIAYDAWRALDPRGTSTRMPMTEYRARTGGADVGSRAAGRARRRDCGSGAVRRRPPELGVVGPRSS